MKTITLIFVAWLAVTAYSAATLLSQYAEIARLP